MGISLEAVHELLQVGIRQRSLSASEIEASAQPR